MFLLQKYTQYKAAQAEQQKKKVTEKELAQLNHKIDKLLTKLDEHEPETADNEDEECVVCVNAKATMTTYPCAHRVICRKCFVKTIQVAVASRLLPLRCVICRAKVLRLKHSVTTPIPGADANWYHVPQSASLYSVTSNTSNISGVSSVSSSSSASSYKTAGSTVPMRKPHCHYYSVRARKQGYEPLLPPNPGPTIPRSATTSAISSSRKGSASIPTPKAVPPPLPQAPASPVKGKLRLVQEFQREFRTGVTKISQAHNKPAGGSTRIKCARVLVCQAQSMSSRNGSTIPKPILRSVETLPSSVDPSLGRKKSAKWDCSSMRPDVHATRGRTSHPPPPPSSISCPSFKQVQTEKLKDIPTSIPPNRPTTLPPKSNSKPRPPPANKATKQPTVVTPK